MIRRQFVQIGEVKYVVKPVLELNNPKNGYVCYPPSYWIITPDYEVLFAHGGRPQAARNLLDILQMSAVNERGFTVQWLPMMYIPADLLGYRKNILD